MFTIPGNVFGDMAHRQKIQFANVWALSYIINMRYIDEVQSSEVLIGKVEVGSIKNID